jgi:hypothetical protein
LQKCAALVLTLQSLFVNLPKRKALVVRTHNVGGSMLQRATVKNTHTVGAKEMLTISTLIPLVKTFVKTLEVRNFSTNKLSFGK